ncbi:MAG TPA: malto-oligosyltrehalose trehalohydrolase [Kofleriaceae bacterium]|nr:malto-oligosyltrehalose trehalohydrolase [Kofleriaceae bacterium]
MVRGGADPTPDGVHFRVWAPATRAVEVVLEGPSQSGAFPLEPDAEPGYFSGLVRHARAGILYRYRLSPGGDLLPDPASRFQPDGPFGPSQVIDPAAFAWSDAGWRGIEPHRHVFYEMHVGTFTAEGTWPAAAAALEHLVELGVTTVELLPVADFPGRFGWGYDGVDLFAPTRLYGTPDDMRGFVDRAHALGLAVVLDVVYNHLGPRGNFLFKYAPAYRSERHASEWGDALNYDGDDSGPVRELMIANAGYWIDELHLDGLRLDATQALFDDSPEHIVTAIQRRAREAGGGRRILVVGENEPQEDILLRSTDEGGHGLDALWSDDFHHAARVAATGSSEAYFSGYAGSPQELISAVKRGFLYQGQMYRWQKNPRGSPVLDLAPGRFVHYLQNHDQVANTGTGDRLHRTTSPGRLRALTALLLLSPELPLLFQGQEFAASRPWRYFADHDGDLARDVARGRAAFLSQFASLRTREGQAVLVDPTDRRAERECVLDLAERAKDGHREVFRLHRDLLRLRRDNPLFTSQRAGGRDGAVLAAEAFALRFFGDDPEMDRLLLVNLGSLLRMTSAAEPLLAPPLDCTWELEWSSEDPRYGGRGTPPTMTRAGVWLPAHAAVLLAPAPGTSLRIEPDEPHRDAAMSADPDWDPDLAP